MSIGFRALGCKGFRVQDLEFTWEVYGFEGFEGSAVQGSWLQGVHFRVYRATGLHRAVFFFFFGGGEGALRLKVS